MVPKININVNSSVKSYSSTHGKTFTKVSFKYVNGVKIEITTYSDGKITFKSNEPYNYNTVTKTYTIQK